MHSSTQNPTMDRSSLDISQAKQRVENWFHIRNICLFLFPIIVAFLSVLSKLSFFDIIGKTRCSSEFKCKKNTGYDDNIYGILALFMCVTHAHFISLIHSSYRDTLIENKNIVQSDKSLSKRDKIGYIFAQALQSIGMIVSVLFVLPRLDELDQINYGLSLGFIPLMCRLFFVKAELKKILRMPRNIRKYLVLLSTPIGLLTFTLGTISVVHTYKTRPMFMMLYIGTVVFISFGWLRQINCKMLSKSDEYTFENVEVLKLFKFTQFMHVMLCLVGTITYVLLYKKKSIFSYGHPMEHLMKNTIIHCVCTTLCFMFARASCKACMSITSFSIPLSITSPIVMVILMYKQINNDSLSTLFQHNWKDFEFAFDYSYRRLFSQSVYHSPFLEQSMIYNRISSILLHTHEETPRNSFDELDSSLSNGDYNQRPLVYMCATMWHENEEEMTLLLKSIFRMDKIFAKTSKQKAYMFNFETHILFDDAFVDAADLSKSQSELDSTMKSISGLKAANSFVRQFCVLIKAVGGTSITDPIKMPAPYGGRLVWTLPKSQIKLIIHLKDKALCRHKKRWSQVMYMFYLLRFLNSSEELDDSKHGASRDLLKTNMDRRKMEKIFILTIDGDMDFQPESIELLVERIGKNNRVGAVCGQIHPIGSGPLIWLQQFEYAIGHWLQKAAEHKLGSVLCSPGCFSLFRASALNDPKILTKYASESQSSSDYIQYDQGEDRWLCTLLLKRGYLVEYCAASMAYTHAPETLTEFFNQRRRWMPSTMANLADLIHSYKITVKRNKNISRFYILYLSFLFLSTVLGPATIVLTIASAFRTVFPWLTLTETYIISLSPAIFYVTVCMCLKTSNQLLIGGVLSSAYALVMAGVLVATIVEAIKSETLTASSLFLPFTSALYLLAGLFHIGQFKVLIHGLFYLITLPTGYILLIIYSLCSMHIVQWGTRETEKIKSPEKIDTIRPNSFLYQAVQRIWHGNEQESAQGVEEKKCEEEKSKSSEDFLENKFPTIKRHYLVNPSWFESRQLGNGAVEYMSNKEISFWHDLIKKILKPIKYNAADISKKRDDLKRLRNRCCIVFLMVNLFWVVLQFQFEYVAFGMGQDLKGFKDFFQRSVGNHKIQFLGLLYMSCFVITLCLQFWGMLLHRWSTLIDVLVNTSSKKRHEVCCKSEMSSRSSKDSSKDVWNSFSLFDDDDGEQDGDENSAKQ